jgi:hypothetical protein
MYPLPTPLTMIRCVFLIPKLASVLPFQCRVFKCKLKVLYFHRSSLFVLPGGGWGFFKQQNASCYPKARVNIYIFVEDFHHYLFRGTFTLLWFITCTSQCYYLYRAYFWNAFNSPTKSLLPKNGSCLLFNITKCISLANNFLFSWRFCNENISLDLTLL